MGGKRRFAASQPANPGAWQAGSVALEPEAVLTTVSVARTLVGEAGRILFTRQRVLARVDVDIAWRNLPRALREEGARPVR